MNPVIKIQNLNVIRDITILKDIQWEILPGENWAILGANGSGKTSLLSAMTAYLSPTSGTLEVLGSVYGKTDWRKLRKKIGLVSTAISQRIQGHEIALHTVMSGQEAVINLWERAGKKIEVQAQEILRDLECEALANRPWIYLSQGERQRILIGRALMAKYEVLILDEPCAGLDLVARGKFLAYLDSLLQKPQVPSLILVTHHVEEITPAFSHVLLLKQGEVLAAGPKEQVLTAKHLSKAFSSIVELKKEGNCYRAWGRNFPNQN